LGVAAMDTVEISQRDAGAAGMGRQILPSGENLHGAFCVA
jgi:hypothetical protein